MVPVSIAFVNVPEKTIPVVNVPPAVSTRFIPFVKLPAEFVISIPSIPPEFAATSIFIKLSTTVVPNVVSSICLIKSKFSVFKSPDDAKEYWLAKIIPESVFATPPSLSKLNVIPSRAFVKLLQFKTCSVSPKLIDPLVVGSPIESHGVSIST